MPEITKKQATAIKLTLEVGRKLQSHPEISSIIEDVKDGMFFLDVVNKYNLSSTYGINKEIAANAVGKALRGHKGEYFVESYPGLIEEGELEEIIRQHHSKSSKKVGKRSIEEGFGFFSLNEEERKQACIKGGIISGNQKAKDKTGVCGLSKEIQREIGKRNYKNKKGIHGMTFEQRSKRSKNTYAQGKGIGGITTEQRREIGKKSGQYHVENKTGFLSLSEEEKKQARLKGLAALGYTPWIDQEREDVYLLSQKSEYRFGKRANLKLIKKDINKKYHGGKEIRSIKSLANELCRYKKIHA